MVKMKQTQRRKSLAEPSEFSPAVFLEKTLLQYYVDRNIPNIKMLTLSEVMRLLSYLDCSLDDCDITFCVKLSLRLKMLLKHVPPLIPFNNQFPFKDWYPQFVSILKPQLKVIYDQLKYSPLNEKDSKVSDFIKSDGLIKYKNIAEIERSIIELCSIAPEPQPVVNSNPTFTISIPGSYTQARGFIPITVAGNLTNATYFPYTQGTSVSLNNGQGSTSELQVVAPGSGMVDNVVTVQGKTGGDCNQGAGKMVQSSGTIVPPMLATATQANARPRNTSIRGKPNFVRMGNRPISSSATAGAGNKTLKPSWAYSAVQKSLSQPSPSQPKTSDLTFSSTPFTLAPIPVEPTEVIPPPSEGLVATPPIDLGFEIQSVESLAEPQSASVATDPPESSEGLTLDQINMVEMAGLVDKAKRVVTGPVRSQYLDNFFKDFVDTNGAFNGKTVNNFYLTRALNDFMTIHLWKRLDIYSQVILDVFRYILCNLEQFLTIDFEKCDRGSNYYCESLYNFKALVKYVITLSLGKLSNRLKLMQKQITTTINLTQKQIEEMALEILVPSSTPSIGVRLISQNNIVDFKRIALPKSTFTMKQLYNCPGVSIHCHLANIKFGRENIAEYSTVVSNNLRKPKHTANKRILHEIMTKSEDVDDVCAVTSKYLTGYFREVVTSLQSQGVTGAGLLKTVCSEFLLDVEYVSPSRKAIAINSEIFCSLNSFPYIVSGFVNPNQIGLKHTINPEVKIYLEESAVKDCCSLKATCTACGYAADLLEYEPNLKVFSRHFMDVHGYYPDPHQCVSCNASVDYEQLLNERWQHVCT